MDLINIFSKKLALKLFEYLNINKSIINLKLNKKLLYKPIYSLKIVELENFKTYIKTYLAKYFIEPFKSSIVASILFARK